MGMRIQPQLLAGSNGRKQTGVKANPVYMQMVPPFSEPSLFIIASCKSSMKPPMPRGEHILFCLPGFRTSKPSPHGEVGKG